MSFAPVLTEQKPLVQQISCHAFNKDRSMVAFSPNDDQVLIYATNGSMDMSKWTQKYVLLEHMDHVAAIDWHPTTNMILTCGHDRNAYVWVHVTGKEKVKEDGKEVEKVVDEWRPKLCVLRINRAATCAKWSPVGNKFAIGSGMKCIPVCEYEKSQDWWVSKMIKKNIKSTVTSLAWCPNNKLLFAGSSDFKCRVFYALMDKLDDPAVDPISAHFPAMTSGKVEFGDVLAEYDAAKAWVNTVAWSPLGSRLAYAGHGSTVHFVQLGTDASQTVLYDGLPFNDIAFASEDCLVAVGHDNNPVVFGAKGEAWEKLDIVDKPDDRKAAAPAKAAGGISAARSMFVAAADKGIAAGAPAKKEETKETLHKAVIQTLQVNIDGAKDYPRARSFTSASIDGRILYWSLESNPSFKSALKL